MSAFNYSGLGEENVSYFVNFLKSKNDGSSTLKVKQQTAYTNYTLYFNPANADKIDEIVFHIAKADVADSGAVSAMNGKEVTAQLQNLKESGMVTNVAELEKSLALLGYDGYEVLAVYDMSEKNSTSSSSTNGLYNITIPLNQLEKGTDLSDYQVVYYDDNNVPYVMETTYVEGEGIVFTTGHFSKYAIIYKPSTGGSTTIGDVDGDGSVDSTDALQLKRNLAGWKGYPIMRKNADVNENGSIGIDDVTILERYIIGWDDYKTLPYKSDN